VNVRHLELFYHVVRNQGISRAVGRMPFGIQQPALSEQIKLLEDHMGGTLFERQPFRLTAMGQDLYAFARPFFEDLERVVPRLRNRSRPLLRVASDETMIQQYVGPVLQVMRRLQPETRLTLSSGAGDRLIQSLREGEVDMVITAIDGHRPHGLAYQHIATRRLVLIVERKASIRAADTFWEQTQIVAPLISPCSSDGISQVFQRGLKRGSIEWSPQIVASSVGSVAPCVASGAGVGVTLGVPYLIQHPKVRALPLDGFDVVTIAAIWRPEDTARVRPLITTIRQCVAE
jgi:DNA-binding transcriptional LysR family regulator